MPEELLNRVVGMLMQLWALVPDPERKQLAQQTIQELRAFSERMRQAADQLRAFTAPEKTDEASTSNKGERNKP